MKHIIRRKPYLIPLFFILGAAAFALFGWVVMALWNAALVPAAGANIISFWQAIGLLILSRILVGGFGGRGRGSHRGRHMRERWMNMTAEEKEQFRDYCRGRWESSANSDQPVSPQ